MKGYIYTMKEKADPDKGWIMNDPILEDIPTLGACMPNIRKNVSEGDYIFCISGRYPKTKQYIVGGFKVTEKITAFEAARMLPDYIRRFDSLNNVVGNIIIDKDGNHSTADYHSDWEKRLNNYIVGRDPIFLQGDNVVEAAREETVPLLADIFDRDGDKVFDVVGRWRRLNEKQVQKILNWFDSLNEAV